MILLASCANRNANNRVPATIVAADEAIATVIPSTRTTQPQPTTPSATPSLAAASTAPAEIPKLTLEKFVDGLTRPVYLTHTSDDSGWLYIIEQPGRIRVVQEGALVETPFLNITDRVGSSGNEQGLLSMAFAPDYKLSGYFYVNYTNKDGDTIISRFSTTPDRSAANADSELVILKIDQPYANHNGGQLQFGPDKMLYIGMGDGGSQGDPKGSAQDPQDLLGKLLRIDVQNANATQPYAIPVDNPKWDSKEVRPEIWAFGLRNPWRFSFDRTTGNMFIADVGQNTIEEVNVQPADIGGLNYGWNKREGQEAYAGGEMQPNFTDPVTQYQHSEGCSITGGYVYRGQAIPALQGVYVYGDYCNGNMWALRQDPSGTWVNTALPNAGFQISSFGEDAVGELYVMDLDGTVYRVKQS